MGRRTYGQGLLTATDEALERLQGSELARKLDA